MRKGGGGVGALAVGQRRLRVGRREVGRLKVGGGRGGGRVAQWRRGSVGRLGQGRQAGPASRCAQPVGALLRKEKRVLGEPFESEKTPPREVPLSLPWSCCCPQADALWAQES